MPITASAVAPLLTVTVAVFAAAVVDGSIGPVLVTGENTLFAGRYVRLDGTAAEVRQTMIGLGFDEYGPDVAHVYALLDNPSAPTYVLYGRRSPVDATWEAALTAILAEIGDADEPTPAYLVPVTRVESEQIELFKAATDNGRDMLPVICTSSVAVRTHALGSLEKQLKALNKQGVIIYYDAAAVTSAAVASATTSVGPWAITLDTTTSPPQASASVVFDNGDADTATLQAQRGTVLGSNSEPFDGEPGWHLDYVRDADGATVVAELSATAAVITGTNLGPFPIVHGQPVRLMVRGNPVNYTVDKTNYAAVVGDNITATATEVAAEQDTALGVLGNAAAVGNALQTTDAVRGNTSEISYVAGTSAAWATALGVTINATAQGSGNVGNVDAITAAELQAIGTIQTGESLSLTAEGTPAKVRVSGLIYGTGGSVQILASSTAGLLTALGLTAGITAGSGDVVDARKLTPAELFTLLSADWSGTADVLNNAPAATVTVSGGEIGAPHIMRIEGALAEAVGLGGTFAAPGSADQHPDAAWVGSRAGIDHGSAPPFGGCLTWNNVALRNVTGERKSFLSIGNRLNRTQDVNYVIRWTPARGGEIHDGRLLIRHVGGASAYADQWEAAHWIAKYAGATLKASLDQITDSGNQVPYQDPNITAFFQGEVRKIASPLYANGIIASIDLDPTGPTKATGLTILRKAQLSGPERDLRFGKLIWSVELSGALHGGIFAIGLLV